MSLNVHQLIGWTAAHQLSKLHEDDTPQSLDTFASNLAMACIEDPEMMKTIQRGIEKATRLYQDILSSPGGAA